jgi:hypothetical protein
MVGVAGADIEVLAVAAERDAAWPLADRHRRHRLHLVEVDDRNGVALLIRDISDRRRRPVTDRHTC